MNGSVLFEEALVPRTPDGDDVGAVVFAGEVAEAGAVEDDGLVAFFGLDECEAPRTPLVEDGDVVPLVDELLDVDELFVVEELLFVTDEVLFVTDELLFVTELLEVTVEFAFAELELPTEPLVTVEVHDELP